MIDQKAIGNRIQQLRLAKGLTQSQTAEAFSISDNYLSNIETGRDVCSTKVFIDLANLLDASIDYLLGDALTYNQTRHSDSPQRDELLHIVGSLTDEECVHLLKYILIMRGRYDAE